MYNIIYPNNTKYDQYGHLISCTGSLYGNTACASAMTAWLAQHTPTTPAATQNYAHAHKTVECWQNNNNTLTKYTEEAFDNETNKCALVQLNFGYWQWQDNGSITCGTGNSKVGYKLCKWDVSLNSGNGGWADRATVVANTDTDAAYRTLGYIVMSST